MPMQRPQEAETARPLLPTQLRLSGKEDLPVHPQGGGGHRARRIGKLQKVPPLNRPVSGVGTPTRQFGTQIESLIASQNLPLSSKYISIRNARANPPPTHPKKTVAIIFRIFDVTLDGGEGACTMPIFASFPPDRKSTRLNSSHLGISYAV